MSVGRQEQGRASQFASKNGRNKEDRKGGGRRYGKQGSAYPIRINSKAIHSKDRGRGVKGKERRGKGGGRAAITLNCQVWLQHIKYNHVYRVGVKGDRIGQ